MEVPAISIIIPVVASAILLVSSSLCINHLFIQQVDTCAVRICKHSLVISQWNWIDGSELKMRESWCRFTEWEVWNSYLESRKMNGLRNYSNMKGPLEFNDKGYSLLLSPSKLCTSPLRCPLSLHLSQVPLGFFPWRSLVLFPYLNSYMWFFCSKIPRRKKLTDQLNSPQNSF